MKKFLQLLAVSTIVLLIAACGNGGDTEGENTDETSSDEDTEETSSDEGTEEETTEDSSNNDEESSDGETESNNSSEESATEESEDEATEDEGLSTEENMTDGEEETKTFVIEEGGMSNTLVYTYVDDEVRIQTSETTASYEDIGFADEEAAREELDQLSEDYQEVDGVEHNIEYEDEGFVETLEVDYDVADIAEVSGLEGSDFEGDVDQAQFISMTQTEEQLLNQGYELEE